MRRPLQSSYNPGDIIPHQYPRHATQTNITMSSRPIRWNKVVTPLRPKAKVVSGGDDARNTFPSAGKSVAESVVPETSRTTDKSSLDEEAVRPLSKLEKGKTVESEQEQPPPNVAPLSRMAPEEISSQAMPRGSALPSSSAAARKARSASPYDVENMRVILADTTIDTNTTSSPPSIKINLQSPRTSILDSVQDSQEPIMLTSFSQTRLTDYELQKESQNRIVHLSPHATEQKRTDLEEDLRRRWGDNYPTAIQVSSSEEKPLDMLHYGRTRETKQEPPNPTPKFELSLCGQTVFAVDPSETLTTPDSPNIPAADQARGVMGGNLLSLDPDPLAPYRSSNAPPRAVEHRPRRYSDTGADKTRPLLDTGGVGQLIVPEPNHWYVQGLRTRPVFGSFPDYNIPGRTEAEGNDPAVDEADPDRDTRPRVRSSLDGELNRIIGKVEMLEIMTDFVRKQTDTFSKKLKRRPEQ